MKNLIKILEHFSRRKDIQTTFHHLIDISYTQFCSPACVDSQNVHSIAIKYLEDKAKVNEFIAELVKTYHDKIKTDNCWHDPLGELYMELNSSHKASGMGQFFTPEDVCTMMAELSIDKELNKPLKISDPSCGSGRTLLAYNSFKPGYHTFFAEDLDLLCCKMTMLNFCMHSMTGEVVNHNTLCSPDSFYQGWRLQRYNNTPMIQIIPIEEHESIILANVKKQIKVDNPSNKQIRLF